LRDDFGYSREKLAELLGIGESSIPRYERGENIPSADIVAKMAQLFHVSSDYLLGLTDQPNHNNDEVLTTKEQKILNTLRHGTLQDTLKLLVEDE